MKTIEVDFNMITDLGWVVASQIFASEELHVGDDVSATDFSDEDLSFVGKVIDIDSEGTVYLEMDWEDAERIESRGSDMVDGRAYFVFGSEALVPRITRISDARNTTPSVATAGREVQADITIHYEPVPA